jgi:hypothetical protein
MYLEILGVRNGGELERSGTGDFKFTGGQGKTEMFCN